MKIVILDGYTENPGDLSWEGFEQLGELTVYDRTPFVDEEGKPDNRKILERATGFEAVITNKTPLSAETIERLCPTLKYIGVLATGYNVIDTAAAKAHGIPVCNIPTYGTTAVAQFAMALLLEMCHHVGEHSRSVKNGDWCRSQDFSYWNYPLVELYGKTMGIIGYGRIGRSVGNLAHAFGMKVLAYDTYVKDGGVAEMVSLDTLLEKSDVISLHCPLFPETKGIINEKNIARMKDGVMIINTSRGPLVVEEDLAKALESGKVACAAVDVLETEPPKEDDPLLKARNCIVTPHIAWAPKESRKRLMDIAVSNLKAFEEGKPQNVVDP